jgi:hypothetical protein
LGTPALASDLNSEAMPKNPQATPSPDESAADALGGKMIPPPAAVMTAGQIPAPAPDAKPLPSAEELEAAFKSQRIGRVPKVGNEGAPEIPPSTRAATPQAPSNPFAPDRSKALIRAQLGELTRGLGTVVAALNTAPALRAQITALEELDGAKAVADFEGVDLAKAAALLDDLIAARTQILGE